jgi:hypothetical protein
MVEYHLAVVVGPPHLCWVDCHRNDDRGVDPAVSETHYYTPHTSIPFVARQNVVCKSTGVLSWSLQEIQSHGPRDRLIHVIDVMAEVA